MVPETESTNERQSGNEGASVIGFFTPAAAGNGNEVQLQRTLVMLGV